MIILLFKLVVRALYLIIKYKKSVIYYQLIELKFILDDTEGKKLKSLPSIIQI